MYWLQICFYYYYYDYYYYYYFPDFREQRVKLEDLYLYVLFFLRRRVFDGIEEIFKFEYGTELGLEYIIIYRDSIRQQQQKRERRERNPIYDEWVYDELRFRIFYFIVIFLSLSPTTNKKEKNL